MTDGFYRYPLLVLTYAFCNFCFQVDGDCRVPNISPHVIVAYPEGEDGRDRISERNMVEMTCKDGFTAASGDSVVMCLDSVWQVLDGDSIRPAIPFRCKAKECPVRNPLNGLAEVKGKTVLYSCNRGHRLVGTRKAMCRLNKKKEYYVTMKLPTCIRRPECKLPVIPHLSRNGPTYDGQTATFSCPDKYGLVGNINVTCDATGNWEEQLPYCELIPTCDDPGMSANSNRSGDCCNVGMSLTYICEEGYEFLDADTGGTITCLENDKWSDRKPICIPIGSAVCPDVPTEYNLMIEGQFRTHSEVYLTDDELDLACVDHYKTNQSSLSLHCLEDGTWSAPFPVCYPMSPCGRPRIPKNGRIIELENNDEDVFCIGFEINIECDEGYTVQSGLYGTKCVGDNWESEPQDCTRISCSDPGVPDHGSRVVESFYVGGTVSYSCLGKYRLIGSSDRTCLKNGRWSGMITVCDDGASHCIDPGVPVNSHRTGYGFKKGDIVSYSCKSGYTMFGKNSTRECLQSGSWSGEQIECYGENEFTENGEASDTFSETLTTIARSAIGNPMQVNLARNGISTADDDDSACVNVFFLLDVSASITQHHFEQAKEFIKIIIRKVGISEETLGVRASVISFSSQAQVVFGVNERNFKVAIDLLDRMQRVPQGTNIMEALNKLTEVILAQTISEPERANARSVAFLISDGLVTEGGTPVPKVKFIEKNYNVIFHAVAIGMKHNKEILRNISSQVLMFANHKELLDLVERTIGKKIDFSPCGLDRPDFGRETTPSNPQKRSKRSMADLARIVGGSRVVRPWPWIAALHLEPISEHKQYLKSGKGVVCGGTIIHSEWILTASHCFRDEHNQNTHKLLSTAQNWRVTAGRTNMSLGSGIQFSIKSIHPHPLYNKETLDYDIALLKVINPIPFDHFVRPICLPPAYADLPNDTYIYKPKQKATIIGWGHATAITVGEKNFKAETQLKEAEIPIQDDETCQRPFNYTKCKQKQCQTHHITPTDRMMCAGDGTADACQGDSGGPLMQQVATYGGKHPVDRWFQIGIVSWGIGCGQKEFNSFYTHTAKMHSFITNVTGIDFENISLAPV